MYRSQINTGDLAVVSQQIQPVQTQPCSPDIPQGTAGLGCGAGVAAGRAGWPRCFPSMAGAGLLSNLHVTPLCSCTFHSPDTRVSVLWGRDACSPRAELGCSCSGCPRGTLRCDTGAALGACGALSKAVDALSGLGSSAVAARSTGRALEGLDPPSWLCHIPTKHTQPLAKPRQGLAASQHSCLSQSPPTATSTCPSCVYQNRGKELPWDMGVLVQGELSPR